jgi:hypothetical protein
MFVLQVILGTLLAALVPVVGFNAVMTSEHFASFLVPRCLLSFLDFSPSHRTLSLPTLANVLHLEFGFQILVFLISQV